MTLTVGSRIGGHPSRGCRTLDQEIRAARDESAREVFAFLGHTAEQPAGENGQRQQGDDRGRRLRIQWQHGLEELQQGIVEEVDGERATGPVAYRLFEGCE